MVFIQFAGFTFGKSASAFATPWNGYPGNNNSFLMGGHDTVTGVNNIQYTAQFGNGMSGTIGLDDPTVFHRTSLQNLALGVNATGNGAFAYGGIVAPDIVGNIRVDQAWGLIPVVGRRSPRERFLQQPGGWCEPEQPVGNLRSSRRASGVGAVNSCACRSRTSRPVRAMTSRSAQCTPRVTPRT